MPIAGGKEDVVVPSVVLFVFGIVAVETGCRIVVVVTDCRFRGRLSVSACCYQFFFFLVVVNRPGPGYPWSFMSR